MDLDNWNQVASTYRNTYLPTIYADVARGLLSLISVIENNPNFVDVIPGTSHASLTLKVSGKQPMLFIWYNNQGDYEVYWSGHPDRVKASQGKVTDLLQQLVDRMRSDSLQV